jgi:AcrR family transcriptional regulator
MNMESMDPAHRGVKRRRYDASRRRAEAARTHARVLEVAERLLLSNGYAATSVAAVATAAGVSAELIYKAFGGKAGLVREIQRRGLLGGGPVPARERSDAFSATDMDARSLLREWTRLSTEVAPRVAPITLLVRSALNAERLTAHAGVRRDLTVEQIRDVMWTYTSPDLYDLLVGQRGWTVDQYRDFLFRGLSGQLLES